MNALNSTVDRTPIRYWGVAALSLVLLSAVFLNCGIDAPVAHLYIKCLSKRYEFVAACVVSKKSNLQVVVIF